MDTQIIVGLLGAFGTITAPIIAWKLATNSEKNKYDPISKARMELLENKVWKGYLLLDDHKKNKVAFNFKINKNNVTGSAVYARSNGSTKIIFEGGFHSDKLLKLEYRNAESHKLHFGTIMLEMNGDGDILKGGLVVYGRDPDRIYFGEVLLKST